MESCVMSRNSESYLGGLASSSEQLQSLFDQKTISSLIFPSSPNLKMNDVISSLLQYKAELCSGSLKTDPVSPLFSPPSKKQKLSSSPTSQTMSPSSSAPSSRDFFNTTGLVPNSLLSTSTPLIRSSATTAAFLSNCSSMLPQNLGPATTSYKLPSSLPDSTILSASGSTSLLSTSAASSLLSASGSSSLLSASGSSSLLSASGSSSLLSASSPSSLLSGGSSVSMLSGSNRTDLLSGNPLLKSSFLPSSNNALLHNTSQILSGGSGIINSSGLLNPNHFLNNKMSVDLAKKSEVKLSAPSATAPINSGVKIFQTKQGYTLLICNGYRYSKISTSSNGKKVYWRCTLRSCKGKVHTDVGGGVVYESTHDHPPMAEEFLFSCHSNRLAKEARQIMRFDPMKALKDEIPYSALESTPTFCKIKDRLNIKKSSSSPEASGASSPLKATFPALPSSPLPHLNLDHCKEGGTISVRTTTSELLTELNALRLTHHLCDVALSVNGTLIYAHRVVLAAASQYFRMLFLSNTKLLSYIELRGVDPESVELLVNFAYTGTLNINYIRVTEMLTAANLLNFSPVVDKCCDYLRTKITPQNCVSMRELVTLQGLTKLQTVLDKYICVNWSRIIENEEIYDARPETLLFFLGHDDLLVQDETEVYQVIIRWVRRSPLYRQFYVVEMLRKVRLVQLNAQFLLDNIESEELIRQHRECETLLHQAKNHFLLPERDHGLEEYQFRKRKRRQNVCLLGTDNSRTIAYEYDTTRNSAWEITSTELNRTDFCLVSDNTSLYVIGGVKSEGLPSDEVSCYNMSTKSWNDSLCKLANPRSQACGVQDGKGLYVIGGEGSSGPVDKVEYIDTTNFSVSTLQPLPQAVSGATASLVGDNIIVFGGTTDRGDSDQVFVFNKTIKLWKSAAPIPEKVKSAHVLDNVDQMIYIFTETNQQFRYNPLLDIWEPVTSHPCTASPTTPSSSTSPSSPSLTEDKILTSTSVDGDLYAMRLRNNSLFLDKLEGATLQWIPCCSVDMPLTMHAMCPRPTDS